MLMVMRYFSVIWAAAPLVITAILTLSAGGLFFYVCFPPEASVFNLSFLAIFTAVFMFFVFAMFGLAIGMIFDLFEDVAEAFKVFFDLFKPLP
ncbi:MAG: hypothetical protein ACNI26_13795 [Terasakiella sp.]|uniref:hypothetical protein n=1 Tax=unclassified Terasakiella TaxID=2614952 RepID=UPI003B002D69